MKTIVKWLLLIATGCSALWACAVTNPVGKGEYEYGKKINYADRNIKKLPDISIRYLDERHEQSPIFRPGFTFYDFEVTKDAQTKTISWSSGTGDIGPTYFNLSGEEYVLELKASKAYRGFMNDGEMVVWKRSDYDKVNGR